MEQPISEAYLLCIKLCQTEIEGNIIGKTWIKKFGNPEWQIAIHGFQDEQRNFIQEGYMDSPKADFGVFVIWYNGWLAGELTPVGGIIANGEGANEDTFIEALKKEIKIN